VTFFEVFFLAVVVTVTFTTQVPLASVLTEVPDTLHFFAYLEAMVTVIFAFFGMESETDFAKLAPEIVFLTFVVMPVTLAMTGTVTGAGASVVVVVVVVVVVGATVVVGGVSCVSFARTVGAECKNPDALKVSQPFSSLMFVVALPTVPAASMTEMSALTGALVKL
jgi:hypothetical protein